MDKLKILQWNCRGLNNKIGDLILFSTEEEIDVICVNEVKNWKKTTPLNNYIVASETFNNGHHGSAILVKNSIVIKRIEPVEKETDSICLKLPSFDNFWIRTAYNSPGKLLSTDKIFSGKLKNVFICGDFNAPHHELNCSYDSENGEKILYIIDEGTFKLLNNGYHTYQSFDGKCKNMLDLHFCDNSLFAHFNNFQVSEDLGSDHKVTITTLNLRKSEVFQLKSKINYRKFREHARKLHRSSNLWPSGL